MLVESKDGSSALLGRPKKLRPGVLTCLSGFIEQGESVEEAVAREVQEEAGVPLVSIELLGSQPWPIGALCCGSRAPVLLCVSGSMAWWGLRAWEISRGRALGMQLAVLCWPAVVME